MRISVCIPQYNRSAYLIKGLESLRGQTHDDVEVIVADDHSTDDTATVIPAYLEKSGLRYKFFRQERNLGYDANLRAALAAATGDYLIAMGNDDGLPHANTLADVARLLEQHGRPELALGNYCEFDDPGNPSQRSRRTEIMTGGPELALHMFRAFSCVTGMIFSREAFHAHDTDKYDGSIYVQQFLASRILAAGGRLLTITDSIAVTGLHVGERHANSYRDTLHDADWKPRRHTGGLDQVGRVVCEAILPYFPESEHQRVIRQVHQQLLIYSYSYWLNDYRKNGGYWAAINLALGCAPLHLMRNVDPSPATVARLVPVYAGATIAGLLTPLGVM